MFFYNTKTNCQIFASCGLGDDAAAVGSDGSMTGNDVMDFPTAKPDFYDVSTYQGSRIGNNTAGIVWRVSAAPTYKGNADFTGTSGSLLFSDVCLVNNGSNVYAITVYEDVYGDVYWETYKWCDPGAGFAFYSQNSNKFTSTPGTTIHVDADDQGNAVMIWDDGNNDIYAATGSYLGFGGSPVYIASGTNPDVSVYFDGTNYNVYEAYIRSNGNIYVDQSLFGSIGTISNQLNSAPSSVTYSYPRIASPQDNVGVDNWTVVFQSDGTSHDINGFNSDGGTIYPMYTYTNTSGTNVPADINGVTNKFPVVSYSTYNGYNDYYIWVGWIMDNLGGSLNSFPNVIQANYPIIMKCNAQAEPLALYNSLGQFWKGPGFVGHTNDDVTDLSLAGKHADDELLLSFTPITLYSVTIHDIYTKQLDATWSISASASDSLRLGNILPDKLNSQNDLPVAFKLFDLDGKEVLSKRSAIQKIIIDLNQNIANLPASVYFARFVSDDGNINISQKLFIGN